MGGDRCFAIRHTADYQGHGFFATTDIADGRRILKEHPIVTLPRQEHREWRIAYTMLPAFFDSLDSSEQRQYLALTTAEDSTVRGAQNRDASSTDLESLISDIFSNNMFEHPTRARGRGVGVFLTLARLNHSCCPNAVALGNPEDDSMTLHAIRDIAAGEEVTICYTNVSLSRKRRQNAVEKYGFVCSCIACIDAMNNHSEGRTASDVREDISKQSEDLEGFFVAGPITNGQQSWGDTDLPGNVIDESTVLAAIEKLAAMFVSQQLFCSELSTWYQWAAAYCLNTSDFEATGKWLQLRRDLNVRIRGSDHPDTLHDERMLARVKQKLCDMCM